MRITLLFLLATTVAFAKPKAPPAEPTPAPPAAATTTPADAHTYRGTSLEAMGRHMKAMGMVVKGKVDRPQDLLGHAIALQEASAHLEEWFPAGTGPDVVEETEALPEVWSDPEGFQAAAASFHEATAKLVEVARTNDPAAFAEQFGKVGAACGACHDKYRKDD